MAIPADIMFVRFNFAYASGGLPVEGASIGFHGHRFHRAGNNVNWPADIQEVAEKMLGHWTADMAGYKSHVGTQISLTNVEAYHMDTSNHVLDKGTADATGDDAWAGTSSSGMPYQCSVVASLYGYAPGSFSPDARNKRGRSYWLPPIPNDLDGDGRLSGSAQTTYVDLFTDFFNDVQGTEIGVAEPPNLDADYFDLVTLSVTKGQAYPVRNVGIGRVVDTQRRRRRSLEESRVWGAVSHADT